MDGRVKAKPVINSKQVQPTRIHPMRRYCASVEPPKFDESGQRIFTRAEVRKHDRSTDGWIIIDQKVYNVTTWVPYHPGGELPLLAQLGCDATKAYKDIEHSTMAQEQLEKYQIGVVVEKRRYDGDGPWTPPNEFGEEGGYH